MTDINHGPDSFFITAAPVPAPIVGAGLPGLIAGLAGLWGLQGCFAAAPSRRRNAPGAHHPRGTHIVTRHRSRGSLSHPQGRYSAEQPGEEVDHNDDGNDRDQHVDYHPEGVG